MAKEADKELKETIETTVKLAKVEKIVEVPKKTFGRFVSRANHIIKIAINGKTTFIQPFGFVKAYKEDVKFDMNDAKHLTFVKL